MSPGNDPQKPLPGEYLELDKLKQTQEEAFNQLMRSAVTPEQIREVLELRTLAAKTEQAEAEAARLKNDVENEKKRVEDELEYERQKQEADIAARKFELVKEKRNYWIAVFVGVVFISVGMYFLVQQVYVAAMILLGLGLGVLLDTKNLIKYIKAFLKTWEW